MRTAHYGIAIAAIAVTGFVQAIAGDCCLFHHSDEENCCCSQCGCQCECRKVCRLVPAERKIEAHCWGCQCEDFCVTGCSERGCEHCETICDPCENGDDPMAPCTKPKRFVWFDWFPPRKAQMYTRKKLMKKTIVRKVPGYKWVVEDLCPQCEASCGPNAVPAPADGSLPPVPAAEGPSAANVPVPADVPQRK